LKRAQCSLSDGPNYRRHDFEIGLRAAGYRIESRMRDPGPGDVLVIWNRSHGRDNEAKRFEAGGASVLVAENGYLGKQWLSHKWFALALGHHAGAGQWRVGGDDRWDSLDIELAPWRTQGGEIVIFEQRGIGEAGHRSPPGWAQSAQARVGGRIRPHPGADEPAIPLASDLDHAACVVTWHSTAALRALILGVPVFYEYPHWIGAPAARPLSEFAAGPRRDDSARLAIFRRLMWAQWRAEEIVSGEAFTWIMN
jgi:hypothetical protein